MKMPPHLPFGTRVRVCAYLCRRSDAGWSYRRVDTRYLAPPVIGHGTRVDGTPVYRAPNGLPPLPVPTRWWEACIPEASPTVGIVIGAGVVFNGAQTSGVAHPESDPYEDWFDVTATIPYIEVAIASPSGKPRFARCLAEDLEVIP